MKVKDLFILEGTWDVYENIADQIGVAFVSDGKYVLTDEGAKKFRRALNVPIKSIHNDIIVIDTESIIPENLIDKFSFENGDCPSVVQNLIDLFWSLAGYCSAEDYDKYFID